MISHCQFEKKYKANLYTFFDKMLLVKHDYTSIFYLPTYKSMPSKLTW